MKNFGTISEQQLIELAHNPIAQFFLDKESSYINIIQNVNDKLMRIIVVRDEFKIISFGILRDRNYQKYLTPNGRYINLNPTTKPILK